MVAQAPDRRGGRLAGAVGIALLLAGLTWLLEPPSWRGPALALLAVGVAAGVAIALRRPVSGRLRTPMERLNDAAFVVVIAAVALIVVRLARPWTAAVPGLVGGALIGLALRPPPPGPGNAGPPSARPGPAGPPPAGPGPAGPPPGPRRTPTRAPLSPNRRSPGPRTGG